MSNSKYKINLKILDKYIFKKYLSTFFFTVLIFSMISVIIDISEKIEDFIDEPVSISQIIFQYYINFIPHINWLLWPMIALISVIFFTSRMAHDSEIISVFNAGVSFTRLLRSYLIAGATITVLHLLGNHFVIPIANKTRLNFEHTYIWKHSDKGKTDNVHLFVSPDTKVFIKYYNKGEQTAREFRLEEFKNEQLIKVTKAQSAEYVKSKKVWKLNNYEERTFSGINETFKRYPGQSKEIKIDLNPQDFVQFLNQKEMMTSAELSRHISKEEKRGSGVARPFTIELQRRTADSFTILILTIIGLAVASRKVRGGMGLHLAIGIGIGAMYVFLSRFSTTFAQDDSIPSIIGVWAPNILFGLLAWYYVEHAQK